MTVHSPLLNGSQRRPSQQGAILVPNSLLARGNGLYSPSSAGYIGHQYISDLTTTEDLDTICASALSLTFLLSTTVCF